MSRRRTNNVRKFEQDFMSLENQRQAKRLSRQQKRLEKETGIANVFEIKGNSNQRGIKYEDIKNIQPLTETQADFFDAWDNNDADGYMLSGCAGTGKNMISMFKALRDVLDPDTPYHKLVIIRSSTPVRNQGFLKGSLDEKMEVFEAPYIGIVHELTGKKDGYEKLKEAGQIEFISTSAIRGITLNNSIILADEVGGFNWHECKSVMTRVGRHCKVILLGDTAQIDLIYNKNDTSGIYDLLNVTNSMPSFRNFKFTEEDIVRSGLVKEFLIACNRKGL